MVLTFFRVNDIKNVKNFLNPIITITEHSGLTSPDINFYKVNCFSLINSLSPMNCNIPGKIF